MGKFTHFAESFLGADGLDDHPISDAGQQCQNVEAEASGHPDGEIMTASAPRMLGVALVSVIGRTDAAGTSCLKKTRSNK